MDNTGNVRVWPAEEALLLVLLKEGEGLNGDSYGWLARPTRDATIKASRIPLPTLPFSLGLDKQTGITRRPRRILELGAGCTGLLGLGLAMAWGGDCVNGGPSSPSTVKTQATSPPSTTTHVPSQLDPPDAIQSMYVCLTDGHPDCLSSLRKCVALNQTRLPSGARVEVQRLVWKEEEQERKQRDMTQECQEQLHDDDGNESSHPQGCREPFDLIVAADVLFFERFHRALLHTLHTHLHPEGGEAWFLQPSRGGSLERFVALVKKEGGLEVVWEGERGGIQTGGDDGDDLGSAQLQLLKLRCMRQTNGGVNP